LDQYVFASSELGVPACLTAMMLGPDREYISQWQGTVGGFDVYWASALRGTTALG